MHNQLTVFCQLKKVSKENNKMKKIDVENVKEFDIQLFGSDEDPSGEDPIVETKPTEGNEEPLIFPLIKIGDIEYTSEAIAAALQDSTNKKDWTTAYTNRDKALAEERKSLEAERTVYQAWDGINQRYQTDAQFQASLDALLTNADTKTEIPDEELDDLDPRIVKVMAQVKQLESKIAINENEQENKRKAGIQQMMADDETQVTSLIATNEDPFTFAMVEKLANEQGRTYSEAYRLLQAENLSFYMEKAKKKGIEEYSTTTPPRLPGSGGGGGIIDREKPFPGWDRASNNAANNFDVFKPKK